MDMDQKMPLSRRAFLTSACCVAAAPLITSITLAAAPGDKRLITIVLRGAMDGLHLVQPYADPAFKLYRPTLALTPDDGLIDLDGFYGLNPYAKALLPLWKSGELSFVQSVSTPYRDARSHFDGQDVLENGGATVGEEKTGWLNRALSTIPSSSLRKAIDVNASAELLLRGTNRVDVWSARTDLTMNTDELEFFERLYRSDPPFAKAMAEAANTDFSADELYADEKRGTKPEDVARLAAGMLMQDYRIASFSITGWDTHARQTPAFKSPATDLATAILTIRKTMSPAVWKETVVVAITEFGRTVRENGSAGTDHGTGGMALIAGGGIDGGKVIGQWPGLDEASLLNGRDLMPTGDVRELAAAMLYRQFNISPDSLTNTIFPGLDFNRSSIYLKSV
ncbi:DUF1501 domain-containing protein [Pararhizobium sp. BT-229]|uniref:DUF1501 domain-containing protein n=1 Tax=Pararhizobium sp. BT-229 TaxID=2986923 RepID=UPI0021F7D139|nr:DUF1501 domain-containing protein [Pararhizobium sp. BT-229]MCV9960696.1 DUF1501 domain-containing protein [Pararhizobium sp. BT-229]